MKLNGSYKLNVKKEIVWKALNDSNILRQCIPGCKSFDKEIPGFGELFRELSYKTIGTSAMQSRACAVLANGKYIFALPGSSGGVTDAWDGILKYQLNINHKPCNFVELFPRLKEK